MIEAILHGIFEFLTEVVLHGFAKLMRWVGAFVYSAFSLFRKTPGHYYQTEDFDFKVILFWTGIIFLSLIIGLSYKTIY